MCQPAQGVTIEAHINHPYWHQDFENHIRVRQIILPELTLLVLPISDKVTNTWDDVYSVWSPDDIESKHENENIT